MDNILSIIVAIIFFITAVIHSLFIWIKSENQSYICYKLDLIKSEVFIIFKTIKLKINIIINFYEYILRII